MIPIYGREIWDSESVSGSEMDLDSVARHKTQQR